MVTFGMDPRLVELHKIALLLSVTFLLFSHILLLLKELLKSH